MRFLNYLRLLATFILALGLLLHLTLADRSGVLRAVYYALPWPVLALGWLGAAFLWGPHRFSGCASLTVALVCGVCWCATAHRTSAPPQTSAPALKVLSWNMAHEKLPSADLQKMLETDKPDIVGLVEVGTRHSDPGVLVATLPPGYSAQKLDHAMAIVVRGAIRVVHSVSLRKISKFASLEADVDGVTWRVFIVDGASHPLDSREEVLTRVLTEARAHPRTLIVGDFNTPVESALLDPWRTEFHHAFSESGQGFRETWPRLLPVLTLDHIWSSKDAPPLRTTKRWLSSSDHAALIAEVKR